MDEQLKESLRPLYREYCGKVYSMDVSIWTILITTHTFSMIVLSILLKIYSPLPLFITSFLFPLSVAGSCYSIWCMFNNLKALRKFYRSCVELIYPHNNSINNRDSLEKTKKDSHHEQKGIFISEGIAKYCLVINFIIFIIIIIHGNKIFPFCE